MAIRTNLKSLDCTQILDQQPICHTDMNRILNAGILAYEMGETVIQEQGTFYSNFNVSNQIPLVGSQPTHDGATIRMDNCKERTWYAENAGYNRVKFHLVWFMRDPAIPLTLDLIDQAGNTQNLWTWNNLTHAIDTEHAIWFDSALNYPPNPGETSDVRFVLTYDSAIAEDSTIAPYVGVWSMYAKFYGQC